MGLIFTKLFDVFGKLERRIVIVGFDAAGKATVLYKLKWGRFRPPFLLSASLT